MSSAASPHTEPGPPPPFDPECAPVLTAIAEFLPSTMTLEMVMALRDSTDFHPPTDEVLSNGGRFIVEERTIPGPPENPDISVLICRPSTATTPVAAVYHIHRGGMVVGGNRAGLEEILHWAEELELAVVSVEYRVAPENPHPAPVEDCYAGLQWMAENAPELAIDPARIVVAGTSAGGGLAAAVALLSRDRNGPALLGQVLMNPMLDDRNISVSAQQMAGIGAWDRATNVAAWTALLGDERGGPEVSAYAAPARATDLTDLPPALIDVGSAETFRDEDVAYASAIWAAGGQAELHVWPGGFHGYVAMAPYARISQETMNARLQWLRRLLGAPAPADQSISHHRDEQHPSPTR